MTSRFPPRSVERTVRTLLKHGADACAKNSFARTAADTATELAGQILPEGAPLRSSASMTGGGPGSAGGATGFGSSSGSGGIGGRSLSQSSFANVLGLMPHGLAAAHSHGISGTGAGASPSPAAAAAAGLFDRLLTPPPVDWDAVAAMLVEAQAEKKRSASASASAPALAGGHAAAAAAAPAPVAAKPPAAQP